MRNAKQGNDLNFGLESEIFRNFKTLLSESFWGTPFDRCVACSRLSVNQAGRSKKRAGDKRDELRVGSGSEILYQTPLVARPHVQSST